MNKMLFLQAKLALTVFAIILIINGEANSRSVKIHQKDPWIVIFVHGTVAAPYTPLSSSRISNDELDGTLYQKVLSDVRNGAKLYKNSLMLPQRGLCELDFNKINVGKNKLYAAFQFAKGYKAVLELVSPGKEENFFYSYEWSGALSQKERRLEAIKFNNAIIELLNHFSKKRKHPKLRIVAHSHGGNLSLNLGAVRNYCRNKWGLTSLLKIKDIDEINSTLEVSAIIDSLPDKALASVAQIKAHEYRPILDVTIDELILFGPPVQSETECFCCSEAFDKVYNFYSSSDFVQCIDILSTKKNAWRRAFDEKYINKAKSKIVQKQIFNNPGHLEMWKIKGERLPTVIVTSLLMQDDNTQKLVDKYKLQLDKIKINLLAWHDQVDKNQV